MIKFSIVIPTYNEERDIAATLQALLALDYPNKEIIFVDDSSDATPQIIRSYSSEQIRLLGPAGGRCEARNMGIKAATGEVVCILNADVHLPPDFLQRLALHYEQGADVVLVAAAVENDHELMPRYVACMSDYDYVNLKHLDWTEGFSCRRKLALAAGLFPHGYVRPICAGEDGCFGANLRALSAKFVLDKQLMVRHVVPASLRDFWLNRVGRGQGNPQIRRFINKWSWGRIYFFLALKTAWLAFKIFTIIPGFIFTYRISKYSKTPKLDLLRFYYPWLLENVAFIYGAWRESRKIFAQERLKICDA